MSSHGRGGNPFSDSDFDSDSESGCGYSTALVRGPSGAAGLAPKMAPEDPFSLGSPKSEKRSDSAVASAVSLPLGKPTLLPKSGSGGHASGLHVAHEDPFSLGPASPKFLDGLLRSGDSTPSLPGRNSSDVTPGVITSTGTSGNPSRRGSLDDCSVYDASRLFADLLATPRATSSWREFNVTGFSYPPWGDTNGTRDAGGDVTPRATNPVPRPLNPIRRLRADEPCASPAGRAPVPVATNRVSPPFPLEGAAEPITTKDDGGATGTGSGQSKAGAAVGPMGTQAIGSEPIGTQQKDPPVPLDARRPQVALGVQRQPGVTTASPSPPITVQVHVPRAVDHVVEVHVPPPDAHSFVLLAKPGVKPWRRANPDSPRDQSMLDGGDGLGRANGTEDRVPLLSPEGDRESIGPVPTPTPTPTQRRWAFSPRGGADVLVEVELESKPLQLHRPSRSGSGLGSVASVRARGCLESCMVVCRALLRLLGPLGRFFS